MGDCAQCQQRGTSCAVGKGCNAPKRVLRAGPAMTGRGMRRVFLGYRQGAVEDHGHDHGSAAFPQLLTVEPDTAPAGLVSGTTTPGAIDGDVKPLLPGTPPRTTEQNAWDFASDALQGLLGLGREAINAETERQTGQDAQQDYNEAFDLPKTGEEVPTDRTQDFNTPPLTSFTGPTPTTGSTTTKDEGYSTGTKVVLVGGGVGAVALLTYGATKGKWFK